MSYGSEIDKSKSTNLHIRFQKALESDDKCMSLREELIQMRSEGFSKENLLSELENFRQVIDSAAIEDTVLDVMDFLSGFCSPQLSID
jgi:hypothetical protein